MSTIVSSPASAKRARLNTAPWVAQVLFAAFYGLLGSAKLTQPIPALTVMMGWSGFVPDGSSASSARTN